MTSIYIKNGVTFIDNGVEVIRLQNDRPNTAIINTDRGQQFEIDKDDLIMCVDTHRYRTYRR